MVVRLTEPYGSVVRPNLTEPPSSAEPDPDPERFGRSLHPWIHWDKIYVAHTVHNIMKERSIFLHHKILIYIYDKGHKKSREYEM